jgi:putative ABC transport system permease protein
MEKLFGIPMSSIMVVMLGLLVICLIAVVFIAWRRPVIFKLGIRNIPRRKAQTTLIIVGLMLATLIISAALGTGDTLNRSVNSAAFKALGPLDEVVLSSNDAEGDANLAAIVTDTMPASAVDTVNGIVGGNDDVDAVGGILLSQSPVLNIGQTDTSNLTSIDQVMEVATQSNPTVFMAGLEQSTIDAIGGINDQDGNPTDVNSLGDDGVYIGQETADDLQLKVGDKLAFAAQNKLQFGVVKGIVPDSVFTGSVQPGTASMLMELGRLQEITGKEGRISGIGISNKGGTREGLQYSDAVTDSLKSGLAGQGMGVVPIKQQNVDNAELIANIFVTMFVVFGLFSIGVGILLIVLIFTMLAAERRAEMGMERAVGAQRRQLIQQFISEGAGYTLLSGLVGTALGVAAAWVIAQGFKGFAGDAFDISVYVAPRSLIIAYSLGVVITFLAVALSSWRVSRLNIVAAIRDIPDAYQAHRNRKQLTWGIVMLLGGVLLTLWGHSIEVLAVFTIGMTLIPFGIAAIVTYFGANTRLVLTLAGLYSLVFWLLPDKLFQRLFGEMSGNIDMFFVSGICIVASSTLVIIQNLEAILSVVEHLGGRFKGVLPSVRLAVSYPESNKSRSGMTIAMFSLIVFSLVMVAAINENFVAAFLGDDANAGMDVQVDIPAENPVDDFVGTLNARGVDTSQFEGVGRMDRIGSAANEVMDKDGDWEAIDFTGLDSGYLDAAALTFQSHATGYETDKAVIEALKSEPNVAVVTSVYVEDAPAEFGPPPTRLAGVASDGTFAPATVQIRGSDGASREVKVIGVVDSKISMLWGAYIGTPTVNELLPPDQQRAVSYMIATKPGVDPKPVAAEVERVLLPYGAQGIDIEQQMKDDQSTQQSFMYILQGFMGLGMIVGIAAVGVIAYRAVVERRQQIGMLRALGFQRNSVAQAFVIESAIVVILGVLSGAVLGLILAYQLMTSDDFTDGVSIDFSVPWLTIIVTLIVAIVAALMMAYLPARQAARVLPAEALRYE